MSSFSTIDITSRREYWSSMYTDPLIAGVLLSRTEIDAQMSRLAVQLNEDYAGKKVTIVPIMLGGMIFCSDLVRKLSLDMIIDPISIHSYKGTESTGSFEVLLEPQQPMAGRHVLVVEDIVDSGKSIQFAKEYPQKKDPLSVKIVALFSKPARRKIPIEADYTGFLIPNRFVVGYGLDYDGRFRELPDLCVLDESKL
jgi:hypoxanthine phosphoribosyltransferase